MESVTVSVPRPRSGDVRIDMVMPLKAHLWGDDCSSCEHAEATGAVAVAGRPHVALMSWRTGPALSALLVGAVAWEMTRAAWSRCHSSTKHADAEAFWRIILSGEIL